VLDTLSMWISTPWRFCRESAWAARENCRDGNAPFPGTLSTSEKIIARKHLASLTGRKPRHEEIFGLDLQLMDYFDFEVMFFEIFVWNSYAFETRNPQPFILDCGANIGMATCYFKKRYPQSRIISFEPHPETYAVLESNLQRNGLQDVRARNVAVHDKAGSIEFYSSDDHTDGACNSLKMSTLASRVERSTKRSVQSVHLSDSIEGPVDFLKMDIEGAEYSVLSEVHEKDKLRLVEQMVVEYHHHLDAEQDELSKLLKLLEDAGFGYQLSAKCAGLSERRLFQDVLVFAYRKEP
jgi:FkbM family methyltransferase